MSNLIDFDEALAKRDKLKTELAQLELDINAGLSYAGLGYLPSWSRTAPSMQVPGLYLVARAELLSGTASETHGMIINSTGARFTGNNTGYSNLDAHVSSGWIFAGPYPNPLPEDFKRKAKSKSAAHSKVTVE